MPKITLDIPEENLALFMEITDAIGIGKEKIVVDAVPEWNRHVLNERKESYDAGKTSLTSWNEFERQLDKEDEAGEV